jgi:hypothetical protein
MDIYNSKLAKLFGKINKHLPYAVTTSATCTRYSCSKEIVDKDPHWRNHEDGHKFQYIRLGFFGFLVPYFWKLLTRGYKDNAFEVEAENNAIMKDQIK